jgi:hypothetical protein
MRLLLALLVTPSLYGHPGAPSLWTIQAGANGIGSRIVVPLASLSGKRGVDASLLCHFVLRTRNGAVPSRVTSVRQRNSDEVEFLVRYQLPLPREFEIESTFFELADPGHGTVCRLDLGGHVESFVLDVNNPARRIETGAGPRVPFRQQLKWTLGGLFVLLFSRLALQRGSLTSDSHRRSPRNPRSSRLPWKMRLP